MSVPARPVAGAEPVAATTGPVRSGFTTAVQFLTRLPVGRSPRPPAPLRTALGWFPLVGLVVAVPAVGATVLGWWLWPPPTAAVLAVAAGIATTGAFHEDGLADAVDGLWGGWTPDRRLEIMRDSRIGTYGVVALVVVLGLQVALLAPLGPVDAARALVVGHLVGRASALPLVATWPAARDDGHGARVAGPAAAGAWALSGATVLVAGIAAVGTWLPVVLVAAVPGPWLLGRTSRRRVGGLTGDVLGAANLAAHVSAMAAVAAIARHATFPGQRDDVAVAVVTRGPLVLVVGGQKSGKSGLAARIAHAVGRPVVVVAPARAGDAEMAERIAIHRADRPDDWVTVEDFDLAAALAAAGPDATVIVDALDTWLVEVMADLDLWVDDEVAPWGEAGRAAADAVVATADEVARAGRARPGTTVVIAGQPGLGAHAMGAAGRRWVDLHGRVLQAVSARADHALLVVAGRVVDLAAAGDVVAAVTGTPVPPPTPGDERGHAPAIDPGPRHG